MHNEFHRASSPASEGEGGILVAPLAADGQNAAMRFTFVGTADGHTSMSRQHSGILVETPEGSILLDCGAFVAGFLKTGEFSPDTPSTIWVSHMHSDHVGGLSLLMQSLWLRKRKAPLHYYGPAPVLEQLQEWFERVLLFPDLIGFEVHYHAVTPGEGYENGPFTFTGFSTEHLYNLASFFQDAHPRTCFETFGCSIDYKDSRLVYSADIAEPRELDPVLEKPTNVLICEMTHFERSLLLETLAKYQIGETWLTHYPDSLPEAMEGMQAEAKKLGMRGPLKIAEDGLRVDYEALPTPI